MKLEIRNARVVDPHSGRDENTAVFIADGRIASLGTAPDGFRAERTIDAAGLVACPGLVDLSARLREPGFEYRATLESEMQAAVAGGVTSLACPPDTDPPLDEPGLVEMLKRRAESLRRSRVYPLGALTLGLKGEKIAEMGRARRGRVRRVLPGRRAAHGPERPVPGDALRGHLRARGVAAPAGRAPRARRRGARGRGGHAPGAARRAGGRRDRGAARHPRARANRPARACTWRGSPRRAAWPSWPRPRPGACALTCDVGVHHLHLCDRDVGDFNAHMNLVPPLRDPSDRDALRRGLADGTIDAVCSDHTPVDDDAKLVPFGEAEPGATGLEVFLPLVLKWGAQMKLPLAATLAAATSRAAAVLGIEAGRSRREAPRTCASSTPSAPGSSRARRSRARAATPPSWASSSRDAWRRRSSTAGSCIPAEPPSTPPERIPMENPLTDFSSLPRFAAIRPEHVLPAIESLVAEGRAAIETLATAGGEPTWEGFVEPLDDANERLARAWAQVSHLNAVVNSPALREAYNAALPMVTQFSTEQGQDLRLFGRFKALAASPGFARLPARAAPPRGQRAARLPPRRRRARRRRRRRASRSSRRSSPRSPRASRTTCSTRPTTSRCT